VGVSPAVEPGRLARRGVATVNSPGSVPEICHEVAVGVSPAVEPGRLARREWPPCLSIPAGPKAAQWISAQL